MRQGDLERAVARATGEAVSTIRRMGFQRVEPFDRNRVAFRASRRRNTVQQNRQSERQSDSGRGDDAQISA
ncbi:hypothetical protein Pan216_07870 [Planctomycetes bacterium Pan216]|uniref:Uncharacterized protein n=1 Tax=Kolteria novifilia TaxID=2527975 RepID=A0A518AZ12_9BACT|nr:hypothetical protein Pan216_07870 [Planctomycetes bacterium Pan216]